MESKYTEDMRFTDINYEETPLQYGAYECCSFMNCEFSKSNLAEISFIDCVFENCNLSMASLAKTILRDVKFLNCKMLGIHFENCNQFGLTVSFDNCNLSHSSFYQAKLKKTVFKNCNLQEVDFTETDISYSLLEKCDLADATFENTIMEKADFRSAFNYSINPEINRIKKAKFSLTGLKGLLGKYDIEIVSDANF
jgi:uncharacterized protein YjbI with pentapeptide repeats